ncbi:MAG: ATP-dependent RecD-like DNA helicase, partial [Clostridia bacterium]|nr:ATP-dependent RecD-like DNA helicase [Clostridia bacterium]
MEEMELEVLEGIAEELVFRREDTGFTVLDISTEDGELITVVGVLPEIAAGEELRLSGRWDTHSSFGRQFRAEFCERRMPGTVAQMLKYLASGSVKGIGPSTAVKIIEAFGEDTFEVLGNHPEKLAKIRGISQKKAEQITEQFREQYAVRETMMALETLGLSPAESINAFRVFGDDVVQMIRKNPYILCLPEVGMSFERVDALAGTFHEKPDPGFRIRAGILHVVNHNLNNGHTCLPREKLLRPAADLLGTNHDTIDIAIDDLAEEHLLRVVKMNGREFVFLPYIFDAEYDSAQHIRMMVRFPPAGRPTLDKDIERVEKSTGIRYEGKQREAIVTAVEKGILILTGGPGTGKTTTV